MPGVHVPRFLPYKSVMSFVRSQDIGELQAITTKPGGRPVYRARRTLRNTIVTMTDLFLSNSHLQNTLRWFGEENTFHFAVGSDCAQYGKADEEMAIWSVSCLNRGRRIGSPQDNFLLLGARRSEASAAMKLYASELDFTGGRDNPPERQALQVSLRSCHFRPEVLGNHGWRAAQQCNMAASSLRATTRQVSGRIAFGGSYGMGKIICVSSRRWKR